MQRVTIEVISSTKKPEQKRSGFYLSYLNHELRRRLRTFIMQF